MKSQSTQDLPKSQSQQENNVTDLENMKESKRRQIKIEQIFRSYPLRKMSISRIRYLKLKRSQINPQNNLYKEQTAQEQTKSMMYFEILNKNLNATSSIYHSQSKELEWVQTIPYDRSPMNREQSEFLKIDNKQFQSYFKYLIQEREQNKQLYRNFKNMIKEQMIQKQTCGYPKCLMCPKE